MKTIKFTLSILLVLVLLLNKAQAQTDGDAPLIDRFSIGANFGSLLHYGDIKQYNFWPAPDERKWGYGAVVNFQVSPVVSFQIQGLAGKLAGIKRNFLNGNPANLKFNADIIEGSINATVSLNRWLAPNLTKMNEKLNFYAMGGVGLIDFRTQLRGLNDDKFIKSYGYSKQGTVKEKMTTETTFPVGLGIKYKAAKKIDIVLEAQLRNVYSDKLDAYVRPFNSMDKYGYTYIGVSYRLGKQEKHMEWIDPDMAKPGSDKLALEEANRKIEELNKKIADTDPRFAELNQKVDDLNNKVKDIESKTPTGTYVAEGGNVDVNRLNELNQKLAELDEKNKDLNNRLLNLSTTTVVQGGGAPILISVFFEVNKSEIDKTNDKRVAAAAKYMKDNPAIKIELTGHADKTGGQKYNELLSERRAKAVQKSLVEDYGIDASRLSISYKGFADPLSKQNYDVNRRVDFIIK